MEISSASQVRILNPFASSWGIGLLSRVIREKLALPASPRPRCGNLSQPRRACGHNPIPIVIPCHRVLAKGGIGGYSGQGGLDTKRVLLRLEGALPETS